MVMSLYVYRGIPGIIFYVNAQQSENQISPWQKKQKAIFTVKSERIDDYVVWASE